MEHNEKALLSTLILILASSISLLSTYSYLQNLTPPDNEGRIEFIPPRISVDEFPFTTPIDLGNTSSNLPFNFSDFPSLNLSDLADSVYLNPFPIIFHNSCDSESPFTYELSNMQLFNVSNAANTAYLSNFVGSVYDGGFWRLSSDAVHYPYEGQNIDNNVVEYSAFYQDRVMVIPLVNISGFIPTSVYTTAIVSSERLIFYPEEGIFYSTDRISDQYEFTTVHYAFEESVLRNAETTQSEEYLRLPRTVTDRTRWLAGEIIKGYSSPFEKAKAIELYLKSNYEYDPDYTHAPPGHEPVDWFLFEEKKGVCTNFASAFVVMARSVGLPSRLVAGFVITPKIEQQTVFASQAHAWAEVEFQELGWILFEPTSGGEGGDHVQEPIPPIETVTNISSISHAIVGKGEEFFVTGDVSTVNGEPVDEMPVEIYLVKIEGEKGVVWGEVCGEGKTENGFFNITCEALVDIAPGEYLVVAHSLGRLQYFESWSDTSVLTPTVTDITFMNTTSIKKGEYFQVVGTVLTEKGVPLDGVTVTIHINETKGKGGLFCGEGETKNGTFTITCQIPDDIEVGGYQIIAHAHQKGWRLESWSDPEITVISATELTLMIPERIELGKNVPIKGRLTDEDGNPLNGSQTIEIYINGTLANESLTDEMGYFSAIHNFSEAGNYTIEAVFLGTSYYEESNAFSNVEVAQIELEIYTRSTFIRGENLEFSGKASFGGKPLLNEPLEILLDDEQVGSTVTDAKGEFSHTLPIALNEKLGYRTVLYSLIQFGHIKEQSLVLKAKTHLTPEIPRYVKIGENFTIAGILTEDNGKPIAGTEIMIYVDNKSTAELVTSELGNFYLNFSFSELGNYNLTGIYPGADFYLNSSFLAEVTSTLLDLDIYTNDTLLRGDRAMIHGQAWLGDDYNTNTLISIFTDDKRIDQTLTDAMGRFNVSYYIPTDMMPGNHKLRYNLTDFGYVKEQNIFVKIRTNLKIDAPSNFNPGESQNITVILTDDNNLHIPNATVHLLEYDALTDANGSAHFQLWIPEDYNRTEMRLEARFDGTVTYAASSSTETMLLSGETPWLWLLYAFLLAGTIVLISWFALKKGTKKKSLEDKKEDCPAVGQQEAIPRSTAISFPLIEEPYPNVWGVNEDFQIMYDNEGKNVTVDKIRFYANDELIGEVPGASGRISITHRFREKGKYNVICELSGGELHESAKVQRELTIVDYREEIVALYHSFLEYLKERGISIVKDATPMEIQQLAIQMKKNEGMVKNIVRCFEEAQYSIHPVNRKYYKTAWYALYQIKRAGEN